MATIPEVSYSKVDGQTGAVAPSPIGIMAIIAPGQTGTDNEPSGFSVDRLVWDTYGAGPLSEDSSYCIQNGGNTVIPIRGTTSTPGSYGAIDVSGMVGSTVVAAGPTEPADFYDVLVTCTDDGNAGAGTNIGTTGIKLQASLDGGLSQQQVQSLGTQTTFTVGDFPAGWSPKVSFTLTGGNLKTGDVWRCKTKPAKMSDADVSTSLEALRVSSLPWEGVLIDSIAGTSTSGLVDTWLKGLEKTGRFRFALINTRMKDQDTTPVETEAQFATAMQTAVATMSPSIRLCLGTDGGAVTSSITGVTSPRPTSLIIAADAMAIPIGQDPAYVGAGALPNIRINGPNGTPVFHNEEKYQNLDTLLLSTLRSVEGKGANAVYICNANVFSTIGSDYVFLPHIRTMNRACELGYAKLVDVLGKGVGKKPKDPVTGGIYMLDEDRLSINELVNDAVRPQLKGQVVAANFALNTNDDIGANSGAIITGSQAIVALAYIKGVKVIAGFVRSISVPLP